MIPNLDSELKYLTNLRDKVINIVDRQELSDDEKEHIIKWQNNIKELIYYISEREHFIVEKDELRKALTVIYEKLQPFLFRYRDTANKTVKYVSAINRLFNGKTLQTRC